MALYLVQHGKSADKQIDPHRGLTEEGRAQTSQIASVAAHYKITVGTIVHSGKTRARQTAEIFHETLGITSTPLEISGINPLDDVRAFATTVDAGEHRMVVGHLPFLQRLLSFLTTGSEDIECYRFQNSGIVCLDCEPGENSDDNWFITWTLNPVIS